MKLNKFQFSEQNLHVDTESIHSLPSPATLKRVSSIISTVPHEFLASRNEIWMNVQNALLDAFLGKDIADLTKVLHNARFLAKSSVGPFIFEYYQNQIVKNAMRIIRKDLNELEGNKLLTELEKVWTRFYRRSLPDIKLILNCINTSSETLECVTMAQFKERVILKTRLEECLQHKKSNISPTLKQMMIILYRTQRAPTPSAEDLQFESLLALVVLPLIGHRGIYFGSVDPVSVLKMAKFI